MKIEGDGQAVNDYTDEDYGHDNYDGEDESTCQFCKGRGYQTTEADGGGPAHACPDCGDEDEE